MDDLLKMFSNWDALSIIAFILVFKGIDNMKNLTASIDSLHQNVIDNIKSLTDSVNQLLTNMKNFTESVNQLSNNLSKLQLQSDNLQNQITNFNLSLEQRFNHIDSKFDEIEAILRDNFSFVKSKINDF